MVTTPDTSHLSREQLDAVEAYGLDLAAEGWVPKAFPNLAAPGTLFYNTSLHGPHHLRANASAPHEP